MEEIKCMVKDISIFQENCPKSLTKVFEMSSCEKECFIQYCDNYEERGKVFESKDSEVCMICSKIHDCVDNIIKELNLPSLVVGNQLLKHDQIQEKLKEDHLKRMIELSRFEELTNGMLEKFVSNPTKDIAWLHESLVYM